MHYLSAEEVLLIHAALIDRTGGLAGVRDAGPFQAVLARPRQSFQGKERYPTMPEKAATYLHGFATGHVFTDGNKRIGFAAAIRFLNQNGYQFSATNREVESFVLAVVTNRRTVNEVAGWLADHSRKK
jgi:death-on-curing protein